LIPKDFVGWADDTITQMRLALAGVRELRNEELARKKYLRKNSTIQPRMYYVQRQ